MPIRFRCAYCNQLMGISTRKAGTVVKCPKCAGEIIVPSLDTAPPPEEPVEQAVASSDHPATAPATAGSAFEAKEFDDYFHEATNGSAPVTAPVRTETAPQPPAPDAAPAAPPPPPPPPIRRGLFLGLPALILSVIAVFVLLVLVFVLGVVIGKHSVTPVEAVHSAILRSAICEPPALRT